MKKTCKNILMFILLFISAILVFTPIWIRNVFGDVTLDEAIFNLNVPLKGSDVGSYVIDGIKRILIPTLVTSIILYVILQFEYKCTLQLQIKIRKKQINISAPRCFKKIIYLAFFVSGLVFCIYNLEIIDYVKRTLTSSNFIEDNYVEPDKISMEFPKEKRNLIYIMLESMESSYASVQEGGILEQNLIPNLTSLANENTSFSNTEKLGGAYNIYGSTWTIAAMVSHFSGIPLKLAFDGNAYGSFATFLPGLTNLGDILEAEGYNQLYILGSNVEFGGRDSYMKQHGNFDIFDYDYAVKNGYYKAKDYVWWGYDDNTLYTFAKDELIKLASKNEPFNLTLLTVDTHFEDGYLSESCTDLKYDDKYSNVISCADNMVYEFVNWIKQQDFYENTTVVIVGDHLTMDVDFFENYKESESDRRIYNTYINSAVQTNNIKNREFSTMDLFPTTLASLGVKIDGDMLGLGTNLFSNRETLIEKYGFEYVHDELSKKSKYYDDKFLYNTQD